MAFEREDVLRAARAIRPILPNLLPAAHAQAIDDQLASYLARAQSGEDVQNDILALLAAHEPTRGWTFEYLETGRMPQFYRGFEEVPDDPEPRTGTKFVCPQGDFTWYRPFINFPVPTCPKHKQKLIQSSK